MLTSSTLDRGDTRLHVVKSPAYPHERRAPVLFLHGYPDTHTTWSHQLEGLAAMHPVAAFDMRGVGDSTPPTGPRATDIARYLDDIDAVIDDVARPGGQVHLVGHDWGGVLGWYMAGDPARARRLRSFSVIAAPHPAAANSVLLGRLRRHGLADLGMLADQVRRSFYMFLFQLPRIPEWYLTRNARAMWIQAHLSGGMRRDDPEFAELDPARARSSLITPLALYRQGFRASRFAPRKVDLPVNLILPLRDMALRPELYDDLPAFVPDLEQHRLDANHWVHRTHAAEVNQILHGFISRHEP